MGTGFAKRKKQAKMMQAQLGKVQEQLQSMEAVGSAGNGLVTITLTGEHAMKQIKIKPECVDPEDIEGLEALIKAAYNDADAKLQQASSSATGGKTPFGFPF